MLCSLRLSSQPLRLLPPLPSTQRAAPAALFSSIPSFLSPSYCRHSLLRRRLALPSKSLCRVVAPPVVQPTRCLSSDAAAAVLPSFPSSSFSADLSLPASEVSDAFEVIAPAAAALSPSASPLRVLVTCEHASQRLPDGVTLPAADSHLLDTHWSLDLGAEDCVRDLLQAADGGVELQVCALLSRCSRLLVDVNRPVDSETLIRTTADGRSIQLNSQLSPHDFEDRVCRFHAPYHAQLQRLRAAFAPQVALSIHSFTPLYEGQRRELEVGVLYRRQEDAEAARLLLERFRQSGLKAELNEPWSGMRGFMHAMDSLTAGQQQQQQQQQQTAFLQAGTAAFVAPAAAEALRNTAADDQAVRAVTAGSSHHARSPSITLMVEFRQDLLTNRRWRTAAVRMLRDFLCSLQQTAE
jgi:predicted N-formylglutamate amidohydrolase